MKLQKLIIASVGAFSMAFSLGAHASINAVAAYNLYWGTLEEISNYCMITWTYDPDPYSNYSNCVASQKYNYAQGFYIAAAMYYNYYYENGDSYYETYMAVGDALYYSY